MHLLLRSCCIPVSWLLLGIAWRRSHSIPTKQTRRVSLLLQQQQQLLLLLMLLLLLLVTLLQVLVLQLLLLLLLQ